MDLYDLAKCALLENMTATSIGLPLWQTSMAALSMLVSQVAGTMLGYRIGGIRSQIHPTRGAALTAFMVLVAAGIVVLIGGLQYLFFLLRMIKDGFYCTYFGAAKSMTVDQALALSIAIAGNGAVSALFAFRDGFRWPTNRLTYLIASATSCAACVVLDGHLLIAGITIIHAFLVGGAWRSR